jgi:antitoxin VapB
MAINVNNPEADALTRKFAALQGVGISEAIVLAMREALNRRLATETPIETAARIRKRYGIKPAPKAKRPLPRRAFDEMWDKD